MSSEPMACVPSGENPVTLASLTTLSGRPPRTGQVIPVGTLSERPPRANARGNIGSERSDRRRPPAKRPDAGSPTSLGVSARNKLASTAGASLAFALAVFGVAAIFCIAIVNVALSSAGNAINQAADEQDFLAASSAAKLVQELVPGKEVTFKKAGDETTFTVTDTSAKARPLLTAMGDVLASSAADSRASKEVTLKADDMPDVTVKLEHPSDGENYDILATIRGEKGNTITVSFLADVEDNGEHAAVTWEVGEVAK